MLVLPISLYFQMRSIMQKYLRISEFGFERVERFRTYMERLDWRKVGILKSFKNFFGRRKMEASL